MVTPPKTKFETNEECIECGTDVCQLDYLGVLLDNACGSWLLEKCEKCRWLIPRKAAWRLDKRRRKKADEFWHSIHAEGDYHLR